MSLHGIAIGDLHFGKSNLAAMFEDADGLILLAVERIFKIALQQGISFVVFLGDICDTQIMSEHTRAAFIVLLKKYDGKLNIRIILGNHDVAESAVHSLHTFETLYHLGFFTTVKVYTDHQVEKFRGVTMEYMAWPAETPKRENSLCFAHYEVSGSTRDNGRQVKEGHDSTFDSSNQFVQGHLHTPHSTRNHWYVGTVAQMSFGERLPKGYGEFKARMEDGKLVLKKRHIQWQPPWSLHNVVLQSKTDIENYPELMSSFGPNCRVKLFVSEGLKLKEDFLLKHPEIINRLDFESDEDLKNLQEEELELETQDVKVSHLDVLPFQLKKLGATKKQIARALEIVEGADT